MGHADPRASSQARKSEPSSAFVSDVREGLSRKQKTLPSKYFYDALGSQLFEAICALPWYPITRAETLLLELYGSEMVETMERVSALVELGPGSGAKAELLARALAGRGTLDVHLVDISETAIEMAKATLSSLDHVKPVGHVATFEEGLSALAEVGPKLVLFLGSNIGNFDEAGARALLERVRGALRPGDGLLLGTDLVRSRDALLSAYDDPLGVTAAFNKNVLLRINAELGGAFDLGAFDHRAVWNAEASRVEMHLVSKRRQAVPIAAAEIEVRLAEGETIWTESSYKYTPESVARLGRKVALVCERQWVDTELGFATTLFRPG